MRERVSAAFGEALWTHFCLLTSRIELPLKCSPSHPFLWRPAMQGRGEDPHSMLTVWILS
jgi:hypothetical protein